jgi:hypothetical protein
MEGGEGEDDSMTRHAYAWTWTKARGTTTRNTAGRSIAAERTVDRDTDDDDFQLTYRSNSYARSRARVPWLKPVT